MTPRAGRAPSWPVAACATAPQVSVVLPVYRNADTLEEMHARLVRTLDRARLTFEIVFVEDACPAGSPAVLAELARRDERVGVVRMARNVGQHRAVLVGLANARGARVVVMDADTQDPPEALPALLGRMDEGFAAVFGGRRGRYESAGRLVTSRLFKWVQHVAARVPADAGLFVALDRELVYRLAAAGTRHPFLVPMIGACRVPMASVPVERAPRPRGRSAYGAWSRLAAGCRALAAAVRWRIRPPRRGAERRAPDAAVRERLGAIFAHRDDATAAERGP